MSTDNTTAVETTRKTAAKLAEKVADTNITPTVVEATEVALSLPSKFVMSGRGVALLAVGATALGAGGLYGVQKLVAIRKAKKAEKAVPDAVVVEKPAK